MKKILVKYLFLFFLLFLKEGYSQACCTAGTPLLGSLETTTAPKGTLQFGLTIEHNALTHVLNGSQKLRNQERERISESILLEINYGITDRISITGLYSFIRQQRTITSSGSVLNDLTASGIGDIALLGKFSFIPFDIFNREEFSVGIGLKMPIGSSDLKSNDILLPADMQPGSGSWDGILWAYYSKGGILLTDLIILTNISYRLNGSNNRFENFSEGYRFGNEFIGSLGFIHPLASAIDLTILSKYRSTNADSFGGNDIPNTGGNWFYIVPGISYYFTQNFSTRIDGEFPVFRKVSGTQLTTTFTASISLFYAFNLLKGSI